MTDYAITPDKARAAVCGLFCPSCTIYIGTHEDPERLKSLAGHMGVPVSELECDGCRSGRLNIFCRTRCNMKACAANKGIEFCGECGEYPCKELTDFQSQMPHRKELWNSLERISEAGWETWYAEMEALYSCDCGTINSAYDIKCRKCGAEPSCGYVSRYTDDIQKHLFKQSL
ncbi:MAG: DUF3795 domain-containing protein [Burkholderiales bacterium]